MRLLRALESDVLIGDGANGTCLAALGFANQPYDFANLLAPELVRQVHQAYFEAGSDFVETNTFQANSIRLEGRGINIRDLNIAGARIAMAEMSTQSPRRRATASQSTSSCWSRPPRN